MAKILDTLKATQDRHEDLLSEHELAIHGHARTETPGLIQIVSKLALKVENHESLKNKFLWMISGASAVGTMVGVIAHFILKAWIP